MTYTTHSWHVAFRRLRKDLGFTLLLVFSLSLGIGAATTVFSLVDALFLRPLPGIGAPGDLVRVTPRPVQIPGLLGSSFRVPLSYPTFRAYAQGADETVELAAHQPVVVHAARGDHVQRLEGEIVSPNYFTILQAKPAIGHLLLPVAERPEGRPDVVVVSYQLWKAWGGDPNLIGSVILLDGAPFTVIGVASPGFHGTRVAANPGFWTPIAAAPRVLPGMDAARVRDPERGWLLWLVGRLHPGVAVATARDRLDAITAGLEDEGASDEQAAGLAIDPGIGLRPGEESSAKDALTILMAVVFFLLLIACLNAAILLLSRVPQRGKDSSVRLALGARRRRLVREHMAESLLLGLGAAAMGGLLAFGATRFLSRVDFAGFLPHAERITVDLRVLCFALIVGVGCTVVFGLAPALRSSRVDVMASLKTAPSGRAHGDRLQYLLVTAQVGASIVLLVGTGLLARSFLNYRNVPLGFDAEHILDVRFDLERQGYSAGAGRDFVKRALDAAASIPGAEAATLASSVPLIGSGERSVGQVSPGTGPLAGQIDSWVAYNFVAPDYLKTLGIRLIRGREFSDHDDLSSPAVAMVNETLADRFWPQLDPVGQWILVGDEEVLVIGLVADTKTETLTGPAEPYFYLPIFQSYKPVVTLHVRSTLPPSRVLEQVEQRIRDLDPHLPLFEEGLMAKQLKEVVGRPRLAVESVGITALIGLLLSLVGIGGVVYRTTRARLREIGIRLSMGASRTNLTWLFLRRGLASAGIGMICGMAGAFALARGLGSFLYGVAPYDPLVFALVVGSVAALIAIATGVPAHLGTRMDPATILREE